MTAALYPWKPKQNVGFWENMVKKNWKCKKLYSTNGANSLQV